MCENEREGEGEGGVKEGERGREGGRGRERDLQDEHVSTPITASSLLSCSTQPKRERERKKMMRE